MSLPRSHDLLKVRPSPEKLVCDDAGQHAAALATLSATPWVVVRRAALEQAPVSLAGRGWLPVGVRGSSRAARTAAWLDPCAVLECLSPTMLRHRPASRELPAFAALHFLRERWAGLRFRWGPTGSVGFELASGNLACHSASDLDVALYADDLLCHFEAHTLYAATLDLPARVDAVLEMPRGAVSLAELAGAATSLLLRTAHGPRLLRWSSVTAEPSR